MHPERSWKRDLFPIWTGQALSLLGSQIVQFALIWWLTETTGSATSLATATIFSLLPSTLLGPIAGTLVDRWPRKRVLIISDGAIALLTALLSILFWLDIAQPWHVYLIIALRSLGDAFQNPAMQATTPLLVPKEQLTRVGSMNAALQGLLQFASPALGAMALKVLGVRGVLPLDVISAMFAIMPLLFASIPNPKRTSRDRSVADVLCGMKEGFRYIWGHPGLRVYLLSSAIWSFAQMPGLSFAPLLVTNRFGGGALELGWVNSAFGGGMLLAGIALSAWGGYGRATKTQVLGAALAPCALLLMWLAPPNGIWIFVAGSGIVGASLAIHKSGGRAWQQKVIASEMQGRFFSVLRSVAFGMTPISLGIAAPIAERIGVRHFWLIGAILSLGILVIRRFTPDVYLIEDEGAISMPRIPAVSSASAD